MTTVILTIHVLIVLALIGVVLLQRSDGSALGIGGGSSGGFMTGAGAADALTRTTSILAALFFATSIGLAVFASPGETADEIIEDLTGERQLDPSDPQSTDDLLRSLGGGSTDTAASIDEAVTTDDEELADEETNGGPNGPTSLENDSVEDADDSIGDNASLPAVEADDEAASKKQPK
ncbi:MAG: preprotein translocase subunit SecG [Pseudomonadota bacterium]